MLGPLVLSVCFSWWTCAAMRGPCPVWESWGKRMMMPRQFVPVLCWFGPQCIFVPPEIISCLLWDKMWAQARMSHPAWGTPLEFLWSLDSSKNTFSLRCYIYQTNALHISTQIEFDASVDNFFVYQQIPLLLKATPAVVEAKMHHLQSQVWSCKKSSHHVLKSIITISSSDSTHCDHSISSWSWKSYCSRLLLGMQRTLLPVAILFRS